MMNFPYVIIEDNPSALKNLQIALRDFPELTNAGVADNIADAKKLILKTKPVLIFLDVELGNDSGFELIKNLRQISLKLPYIIMTTAHDHYGKDAVNSEVLYFLSKPIDPDELQVAVYKFIARYSTEKNTVTFKKSEGHFILPTEDIFYIKSSSNYTEFIKTDGSKHSISKTLKVIEQALPEQFVRVHNSYIINRKYVEMINTTQKTIVLNCRTGVIELSTNSRSQNFEYKIESQLVQKENRIVIPVGDTYLEKVRSMLF